MNDRCMCDHDHHEGNPKNHQITKRKESEVPRAWISHTIDHSTDFMMKHEDEIGPCSLLPSDTRGDGAHMNQQSLNAVGALQSRYSKENMNAAPGETQISERHIRTHFKLIQLYN